MKYKDINYYNNSVTFYCGSVKRNGCFNDQMSTKNRNKLESLFSEYKHWISADGGAFNQIFTDDVDGVTKILTDNFKEKIQ